MTRYSPNFRYVFNSDVKRALHRMVDTSKPILEAEYEAGLRRTPQDSDRPPCFMCEGRATGMLTLYAYLKKPIVAEMCRTCYPIFTGHSATKRRKIA